MTETQVIIIGAGPAGISCALYLKRAEVPFLWLEKMAPGGKLLTIAEISNYPGFTKTSGTDLAQALLSSTSSIGAESTFGDVKSVSKSGNGFLIETDEASYHAKAVVVATGLSNVPSLPGEKDFIGRGISYCATCDGPLYRGKTAAIAGTGDRVLEEALYLSHLLNKVYLLTPDASYKGSEPLLRSLLSEPHISLLTQANILKIQGSSHVESVVYRQDGKDGILPVNVIFPLAGEKSASSFLSPLHVAMERGFIVVDEAMMSNIPGLFAAGDIVKKKLRQVVTACGDGAVASTGVISYLRSIQGAK